MKSLKASGKNTMYMINTESYDKMIKNEKKVIVIGGGPAGVICAAESAKRGNETLLLEKNPELLKKLLITGKGRCNITNSSDISEFFENIPVNSSFMYSSLYSFTNTDIISLLENEGVKTKNERGNRVFPVSDKARDVAEGLKRYLKKSGAKVRCNAEVGKLEKNDDKFAVFLKNGEKLIADCVAVATGGVSYPVTGSTGDGYKFARALGHNTVPAKAGLVPIELEESFCRELTGLSLRNVKLTLVTDGKTVFDDFGEMMFTPFGVTGPIVISASSHLKETGDSKIIIDLKPALSEKQLNDRILRDFKEFSNKNFSNSLNKLLPKSIISVIIELSGINPEKKCNSVTREERMNLVELLKNLTFSVKGKRPVSEAIITSGGISVKEINPSTMESKIVPKLYFAGEVIDVDAYTGGYNLQIAYSTGYLAGRNV